MIEGEQYTLVAQCCNSPNCIEVTLYTPIFRFYANRQTNYNEASPQAAIVYAYLELSMLASCQYSWPRLIIISLYNKNLKIGVHRE